MTEESMHNAEAQYEFWSGGSDHIGANEVQRLIKFHGTERPGSCFACGDTVHAGGLGYNEQVVAYVRYGPYFICAACIVDAFDLPELPWGDKDDPETIWDIRP